MDPKTPPERVTLEYADGFYFKEDSEVGDQSLWEELERRYNAYDELVARVTKLQLQALTLSRLAKLQEDLDFAKWYHSSDPVDKPDRKDWW